MAVQQQHQSSYDIFSLFRSTAAYPFIQQKVLGRHRLPNGQWTSSASSTSLADLDDYCFAHIFRCLPFRDLVRLRRVSRRLHFSVGEYLARALTARNPDDVAIVSESIYFLQYI